MSVNVKQGGEPSWVKEPHMPALIEGSPETIHKAVDQYQRDHWAKVEAERRERAGQHAYEIDENGNRKWRGTTAASLVDGAKAVACDGCKKPAPLVQGPGPGRMLGNCCDPSVPAAAYTSVTCPTCAGSGLVLEAIS